MKNLAEQGSTGQYRTEVFQFDSQSWTDIATDVLRIEKACFGELGYSEEIFKKDFSETDTTVILLRDSRSKVIGYTYALPKEKPYTANVESTAIDPEFQGRGLVGKLIGRLEEELIKRGFKFMERDVAIGNGYADSIQRHYGSRILEWHDHPSDYGPQRFFRIRL